MRIASLLPAATDWLKTFGATGDLVARSHECVLPPEHEAHAPVVTRAAFTASDAPNPSRAIDDAVRERLGDGLSLYEVDVERLRARRPDVILTQTQCEVCAVSRAQLDDALAGWAGEDAAVPRLVSLAPATFKQVLDAGLKIARVAGCLEAAMPFLAEKERRLRVLYERLGREAAAGEAPAGRPTVACIEWLDPLMTAGHWTPDLAEHAGGRAVCSEKGARSERVAWDALRRADPDVLAVMPCGFALDETARALPALTQRPGFADLRAVRAGRVFLFDGDVHFNRPGPHLYRSAELLAAALHPERARAFAAPEPWEMQPLRAVHLPG